MSAAANKAWRGRLSQGESLARYTSWGVGGPADRLFQPADREDLLQFLRELPADEPLCWLGLGSNVLIRDGGIRGSVILMRGVEARLERTTDGGVFVEAAVPCAKLARFLARQGLSGGEFLAGIPGTLGGALAMNAGAYGGETWQAVESVETVDRAGKVHRRDRAEFEVGYRSVRGPAQEWFLAAKLRYAEGGDDAARQRISHLLEQRAATQPLRQRSCGSVFRNPPGDHAARLIESCGLKGRCIGGACVSEKHANFIINTGQARASEIEELIAEVQARVLERTGVALQTEVRIMGDAR